MLHILQHNAVWIGLTTKLKGWKEPCGAFEDHSGWSSTSLGLTQVPAHGRYSTDRSKCITVSLNQTHLFFKKLCVSSFWAFPLGITRILKKKEKKIQTRGVVYCLINISNKCFMCDIPCALKPEHYFLELYLGRSHLEGDRIFCLGWVCIDFGCFSPTNFVCSFSCTGGCWWGQVWTGLAMARNVLPSAGLKCQNYSTWSRKQPPVRGGELKQTDQ